MTIFYEHSVNHCFGSYILVNVTLKSCAVLEYVALLIHENCLIIEVWITILQYIINGTITFDTKWTDYEEGFGNKYDNYWIGLKNMHNLTTAIPHQLEIEIKLEDKAIRQFNFKYFAVESANSEYTLHVDGTATTNPTFLERIVGDILASNGTRFSTRDCDNDSDSKNCAANSEGGWWYTTCGATDDNFPTFMYGYRRVELIHMAIQRVG